MGYLDGITASYLRKNDRGELRYYPYGVWGKAYKVETEQQANSIKLKHNFLYVLCIAICIASVIVFTALNIDVLSYLLFFTAGYTLFFVIYYLTVIRVTTHQLVRTDEKPTRAEQFNSVSTHFGTRTLSFGFALSILIVVIGVVALSAGDPFLGWLFIGIGMLCLISIVFRLRTALRAKSKVIR